MLQLKPYTPADFDWLKRQIGAPETLIQWAGTSLAYPLDNKQLERHYARTRREYPGYRYYKAVNVRTSETVGHGELSGINNDRSAFLTRILVRSDLRGQGFGTKIVRELLKLAFTQFKLHRVELNVFATNAAAIRCYEKVGFVKEGLLRDKCWDGKKYLSEYRMSILEHEFRE